MAEDPQKKEILAPPKMTILSDHPILREEDAKKELDSFTLSSRLGAVYDIIRHKNTRPPLAVAIYGDWGTGKSSAMRWLSDALEQWSEQDEDERKGHARVRTVWFDPWKYAKREDVWRGLISEVILESLPREGAPFKRVLRAVRNFGHSLGRAFIDTVGSIELTGGVEGNIGVGQVSGEAKFDLAAFSKILDDYRERSQPEKAYLNEFETALQDWVEDSLEEDERMVLFIDDLDRCLPGVVLEVLEALKLYLNIPQLIFVVGLDRDVVESVVEKHYAEQGLGKAKAKHYLDKMFQVEVEIPPSQTLMAGYITGQIEAMDAASEKYWSKSLKGWDTKYKKIIEGKITDLAAHNPREVKRLLNSALLRATAAARDSSLGGTEAERFTQGCQVYLIHCYLKKYVPKSGGLLRENAILLFFKAWSDFVAKYPSFIPRGSIFGELGWETLLSEEEKAASSEADKAYRSLCRVAPTYRTEEGEWERVPWRADVWHLLAIPFSAHVAAAAVMEPGDGATVWTDIEDHEDEEPVSCESTAVSSEAPPAPSSEADEKSTQTVVGSLALMPPSIRMEIARQLSKITGELRQGDLANVHTLDLSGYDLGQDELQHLAGLPDLRRLCLCAARVTDEGAVHIAKLTTLRMLDLSHATITDLGLGYLSNLKGLQELHLNECRSISDKGLSKLASLRGLQELSLGRTRITGQGLANLAVIEGVRSLQLSQCNAIDDDALKTVALFKDLIVLDLQFCAKITDEGLRHITSLVSLRNLNLVGTKITKAGLTHLLPCKDLKELWVFGSDITDAEVREFFATLRKQQ